MIPPSKSTVAMTAGLPKISSMASSKSFPKIKAGITATKSLA